MAKFRPDLYKRIENMLRNSPVRHVSIEDVSALFSERREDVAECFKHLVECGCLLPIKNSAKAETRRLRFQKHKVSSHQDLYEIVYFDQIERIASNCHVCSKSFGATPLIR